MKKIFAVLVLLFLAIGMVACDSGDNGNGNNNDDDDGGNTNPPAQQHTLSFDSAGGSSVSSIKKDKGSQVAKPSSDPIRDEYIFEGWYLETNCQNAVSWPITLTENKTVYAKWISALNYLLAAKEKLVTASEFEYNYNLNVTTKFVIAGPSAIANGTVQYNQNSDNSYYKHEQTSGLLLADGVNHTIKTGSQLSTFKVNTNDKLVSYQAEAVASDFKYESSSFASLLFEFSADQIKSVKLNEQGMYQVTYSGGSGNTVNKIIGFLNNPLLQRFINTPATSLEFFTYVTFENGYVDKYQYQFDLTVAGASISFKYQLDFVKINDGVTITTPQFKNVSLSKEQIDTKLTSIKTIINNYKQQTNSEYNYDVKTEVNYPGSNAINSRVQGRTMRNVVGSDVFFWNRIKFDSDYKNSDLYKNIGIVDYERYRVRYSNLDVYDCTDGILKNDYKKLDNYNNLEIDNYYFLIPNRILNSNNISIIQEEVKNNKITYSIGLTNTGIIELLGFINQGVRVDVNQNNEIVIYDIKSGLEIKDVNFEITTLDGKLDQILIDINGAYLSNGYQNTDFEGPCSFSLYLNLKVEQRPKSYIAPTKDSEVDLSNN